MNYPTTYDHWLSQAWAAHMPQEYSYLWFKAQMLAESAGDPKARSPVGALGLFQIMPATWADIKDAMNFPTLASPYDPQYAIQGAAWYMRHLFDQWTAPRPALDKLHLAQSSYNAGFGNLLAAQRLAHAELGHQVNNYLDVVRYLPQVTGAANAKQTSSYVTKIGVIFLELTEDATLGSPS